MELLLLNWNKRGKVVEQTGKRKVQCSHRPANRCFLLMCHNYLVGVMEVPGHVFLLRRIIHQHFTLALLKHPQSFRVLQSFQPNRSICVRSVERSQHPSDQPQKTIELFIHKGASSFCARACVCVCLNVCVNGVVAVCVCLVRFYAGSTTWTSDIAPPIPTPLLPRPPTPVPLCLLL